MYFPVGWCQIEEIVPSRPSSSRMALALAVDLVLKLWGYIGIKLVKVHLICEFPEAQLHETVLTPADCGS